ncbi:FAD binding domain-containing protein [Hydrogenophaga palleronii]|uniref:FAD binding domain-containing protein n=1 Tax=Hydrogenophaga palleronii TaxID=65655 RepID=UPI0009FEFD3A|nr:FAD binding domain-containing protein [Hydrogenophaga palleronii]
MYPFRYERRRDVQEAVSLMQAHPQARTLSGGMTLVPALRYRLARPSHLVDRSRLVALQGIDFRAGVLHLGAAMPHAQIAASRVVRQAIPALAGLAGMIGDQQVRQRDTLGGSIVNNDPAADYRSAVVGLGGTLLVQASAQLLEVDSDRLERHASGLILHRKWWRDRMATRRASRLVAKAA